MEINIKDQNSQLYEFVKDIIIIKRHKLKTISKIEIKLNQISDFLISNSSRVDNLGLISGKFGIAIFLYNYSRIKKLEIYSNYADKLIDKVYKKIDTCSQFGFEKGIIGIAWGIEYLIRHQFVDGNADEILEQVDTIVYKYKSGSIFDIGLYTLARIQNKVANETTLIKEKQRIISLTQECELILTNNHHKGITYLSLDMLNFIVFFLYTVKDFRFAQDIFEKTLKYLFYNVEIALNSTTDSADIITLTMLINKLRPYLDNRDVCKIIAYLNEYCRYFKEQNNAPIDLDSFKKLGIYQLIYPELFIDYKNLDYSNNVMTYYIEDSIWNYMITNLTIDKWGLNGLAGIGLSLLFNS